MTLKVCDTSRVNPAVLYDHFSGSQVALSLNMFAGTIPSAFGNLNLLTYDIR